MNLFGKTGSLNKLVAIKLQGGLGNQMFQYAAAKALAIKDHTDVMVDLSFIEETAAKKVKGFTSRNYELGIFKNVPAHFLGAKQQQIFRLAKLSRGQRYLKILALPYYKIYSEPSFIFDLNFFLQKSPVLLDGYWQSEKYLTAVQNDIRQTFVFPALAEGDANQFIFARIVSTVSISVHVRRADYLNPEIAAYHGLCSESYYRAAIEYMQAFFPLCVFYFFTDDPEWVSKRFTDHLPNTVLIKHNTGADSWKDMYLMSCCSHHIIANSSFSWWGAWLNNKADKIVIAPERWFADKEKNEEAQDNIPPSWIRI